jgi:hypothetical protein
MAALPPPPPIFVPIAPPAALAAPVGPLLPPPPPAPNAPPTLVDAKRAIKYVAKVKQLKASNGQAVVTRQELVEAIEYKHKILEQRGLISHLSQLVVT